jgi:RimJ/RimL family protein N-acetyltransferase
MDSVPLDADDFITGLRQAVGRDNDCVFELGSRIREDLRLDSLDTFLVIDYVHELLGNQVDLEEELILLSGGTIRDLYAAYMTAMASPMINGEGDRWGRFRDKVGITGRSVLLRPPHPDDFMTLYRLAVSEEISWRWRYGGSIPTYDEFVRSFWNSVLTQFVVWRPVQSQIIGLTVVYNANFQNRTANLAAMVSDEMSGSGSGVDAVSAFLFYVFRTWDFYKIYLEVPEFNFHQFSSGSGKMFTVEGELKGDIYFATRRWDRLICSVHKDEFMNTWTPVISRRNFVEMEPTA